MREIQDKIDSFCFHYGGYVLLAIVLISAILHGFIDCVKDK